MYLSGCRSAVDPLEVLRAVLAYRADEVRRQRPAVHITAHLAHIVVHIGQTLGIGHGLLVQVAGLERERIGIIKVLDNYSFIQLFADDAKIAIEKLNGYEYRGRKLMVSYSRKKEVIEANAESGITGEYEKNSAEAGDIGDVQSGAASVSVNENKEYLRDECYNTMVETAEKYSTYEYIKYIKKESNDDKK